MFFRFPNVLSIYRSDSIFSVQETRYNYIVFTRFLLLWYPNPRSFWNGSDPSSPPPHFDSDLNCLIDLNFRSTVHIYAESPVRCKCYNCIVQGNHSTVRFFLCICTVCVLGCCPQNVTVLRQELTVWEEKDRTVSLSESHSLDPKSRPM